ncbi:MAG: twin-arginine translocation signal domain-containing protein [Candidatus Electrothrix sp. ATG2]|nr:twin-arginine translocation signal domain-containing protein [Candidatus Electrothrix sp. ATG2]
MGVYMNRRSFLKKSAKLTTATLAAALFFQPFCVQPQPASAR